MLVLSVIAEFVAFVAVVALVALVAVDAFPVRSPTKVVDVTEVKPANVVTVAPKATLVEPMVTLELTKAAFGMLVNEAPDPLNPVAVKTPVEGLNWYLVDDTNSVETEPDVTEVNNGYLVAFVVVSSEIDTEAEIVVQVGALAPFEVKTCPVVPAAVNA